MKRQVLLVTFIVFSAAKLLAQAPAWIWGKDANSSSYETAWDVAYDAYSTNVYTGGTFVGNLSAVYGSSLSSSYGSMDGFLAKYDQSGNVLWAIKVGGTNNDEIHGVACDGSGNVYVTGYFTGTADFDPSSSNYTLTSSGGADGFLAKYTSAGAFVWATKFGGSNDEFSWKMSADANGVYITGSYESSPATFYSYGSATTKTTSIAPQQLNTYGAKYNSSGVIQWVVSGGSNKDDIGFTVTADANYVYFIGRYDSDLNFKDASGTTSATLQAQQNNKPQVYILSVSQAGSFSWQNNITASTGGDIVVGWSIAQDASNLYVTGYFDGNINFKYPTPTLTQSLSAGGSLDLFLAQISKTGTFAWNASVTGNGSGEQIGRTLEVDANGNVILGGVYSTGLNYSSAGGPNLSSSGLHDVFVTSYSNSGAFLWSTKAGGTTDDYLNGMSVDNLGGIYVCGGEDGSMVINSTTTLQSGGGTNVFVAKLGCAIITNNTVTANQTLCSGSSPATFTGSVPSPSSGITYLWQTSLNSTTWTTAAGTSTAQNYSAPTLTATTYFRRVVSSSVSCSLTTSNSNTITVSINNPPSTAVAGVNQSVCATSTILSATSPTSGTGLWTVTGGGGSLSAASSFSSSVTALGVGTNSFVWTVSSGVCPTSTAMVTVFRYAAPLSNAGTNQTLCSTSATLAAVNPTIGAGTWSVFSGTSSITSVSNPSSAITSLSPGANQFVWTVTNGVCAAATSTVTVTRDLPPSSNAGITQTVCNSTAALAATSPTLGTGLWSVITGTGNVTTPGSFSSAVTALNTGTNQFLWTVSNGSCPTATSAVTILRDISPVSNAGISQTVCSSSATLSASNPTVGSGLWTVVTGTSAVTTPGTFSSSVSSLSIGLNQFVWTVSNGVCPAATSTVNIIRNDQPTANAGTNQAVCSSSLNLAALSPTVGTGSWSQISGTGTIISVSNPSTQVIGIGFGATQFVWTVSNFACAAATSTVTIIRDIPPGANAGTSLSVCSTSVALSAAIPTVGVGSWSVIAGSASVTSPGSYSSQVTSLSAGANQFLWTVTGGACPSATSVVTINRDLQPTANAGTSQTVCASTATLAATSPTIGTGLWSVLSGTASITTNSNNVSPITALSNNINSFVWTVSNGVCTAATSTVTITRNIQPVSNAGTNQTVCASVATLAALSSTIGTGIWSVITGTSSVTTAGSFSSVVTSLNTGVNQFVWTVSNGTCPAATSTVTITRDAQPISNAGVTQSVCASIATLAATAPTVGTGVWTVFSGTGSVTTATNSSSQVNSLSAGANLFVWTVTNGVCAAATSTVTIISNLQPSSNAGSTQTICASTTTLAAVSPTVGTGVWSVLSGGSSIITQGSYSSAVSSLSTGINQFVWTVSNGVCLAATSTVTIIRDVQPVANAGVDQTLCISTATLTAASPTIGNGGWSVLAGTGLVTFTNSNSSPVTGLSTGINQFVWTVTNGVCPASSSTVNIYQSPPLVSNAGNSQTICSTSATLGAIIPTVGTGQWSVLTGTASVSTPTNPASPAIALSTGLNSFLWTVSNGACPTGTSVVSIWRDAQPTSYAGPDQTICSTTTTLNATVPQIGTGIWSIASGTASAFNVSAASVTIIGIDPGANIFVWTVTNGVCTAAISSVTVARDLPPTSLAGSDQTVCAQSATLSANLSGPGNGIWSVLSGTAAIVTPTAPTSKVTSLGTGTTVFLWTVSNGSCPSATSGVSIIQDLQPTAFAGVTQTVCSSDATLAAANPTVGTGTWSLLSGAGVLSASGIFSTQVTALATGTNSFIWTVTNGSCPAATSTVEIIQDLMPSTANAGTDFTVCANSCTLSANAITTGIGSWSVFTGTSGLTSTGNTTTNATNLSNGINQFIWTASNGVCPASYDTVSVFVTTPLPNASVGDDQQICSTECTLTSNNAGYGIWTLLNGTGTLASATSATTQVTSLGTGTTSFVWTVSKAFCPSTSDTIIIVRYENPGASSAGKNQFICGDSTKLEAIQPAEGKGIWKFVSGNANFMNDSLSQTSVNKLIPGENELVWTITNSVCPSSSDTVMIFSYAVPTQADAGRDRLVCSDEITLNANKAIIGNGNWSLLPGAICSITQASTNTTTISGLVTGVYNLMWTISNGVCPVFSDTLKITRTDNPIVPDAGPEQILETATAQLDANVPQAGIGTWSVLSGSCEFSNIHDSSAFISKLPFGTTLLRWTIANESCPDVSDDIVINVKNLNIPNAFSPNGDGMNDKFTITSLDYYENVKISVYNRWGTLLYHNTEYHNDWAGVNSNNENLADDTYYYIIEISTLKNLTGFVIIKRDK